MEEIHSQHIAWGVGQAQRWAGEYYVLWKVVEQLLPKAWGNPYFAWLLIGMCNYMVHLVKNMGFKPRFYNPVEGFVIEEDRVVRYLGCCIAKMLSGNGSSCDCWSTHDSLKADQPQKKQNNMSNISLITSPLHTWIQQFDFRHQLWQSLTSTQLSLRIQSTQLSWGDIFSLATPTQASLFSSMTPFLTIAE